MSIALWIVQSLLALAFLVTRRTKIVAPMEQLRSYMAWVTTTPVALVRGIGVAEIAGAIGLILPVLTGIVPLLTIATAVGLALVIVGDTIVHLMCKEYRETGVTLVLLALTLFVVASHVLWAPLA